MNRILFEPHEKTSSAAPEISFSENDERLHHIQTVLKPAAGETLKLGEIGGARYNHARITEISASRCTLLLNDPEPPLPRAPYDLLLALPRPKCLRRLWPQLAQFGVEKIYITAAEKVEKSYWGSTFLQPEVYTPLLREGLMQSGDTILPEISVLRRLKPFVEDEIPRRYPNANLRLLAHPVLAGHTAAPSIPAPEAGQKGLLAIGPEGGWSPYEVNLFRANGFRLYSLGERIFRTDTAVISLLALAENAEQ